MHKELREHARAALVKQLTELVTQREALEASARQLLEIREPDWGEVNADQLMAKLADEVTEREWIELRAIVRTLVKMSEGAWGRCEKCGGAIEDPRLLASPIVSHCLSCATSSERATNARGIPRGAGEGPRSHWSAHHGHRALEEPEPPRPPQFDAPVTARPLEKGGLPSEDLDSLGPEDLAGRVLEEATEAAPLQAESPLPTDAQLTYEPDEFFPDRVDWPTDDLDEEVATAVPAPRPAKTGRRERRTRGA